MKFTAVLALLPLALAAPARVQKRAGPTVVAPSPQATVAGKSLLGVETFNGIPYAQPPVGQLRLKAPQPITSAVGNVDGTAGAKGCPQFFFSTANNNIPTNILGTLLNTPLFQTVTNSGEDCLTVNVQRPAGTKADAKLPVLFWIFGGGFELGATSMYDGTSLVAESVAQGKPVIFVAVNYRVGGFGFMPGKEVLADGSGNLGLLDQRLGLQWVADNIAAFGGDPNKVTIWGESAGSISVMDQMLLYDGDNTYKGKPLFRGGIMNSGSIVPAQPLDSNKGQAIYDTVSLLHLNSECFILNIIRLSKKPGALAHLTVSLVCAQPLTPSFSKPATPYLEFWDTLQSISPTCPAPTARRLLPHPRNSYAQASTLKYPLSSAIRKTKALFSHFSHQISPLQLKSPPTCPPSSSTKPRQAKSIAWSARIRTLSRMARPSAPAYLTTFTHNSSASLLSSAISLSP
jgi:hypothetical protein